MDSLWGVGLGCIFWHVVVMGLAYSAGRGWLRSPIAIERGSIRSVEKGDPYAG
jgi:hypothetical protein